MSDIKNDLKDLIENLVIPEVNNYLEDLHKLLEQGTQTDDDLEAIKDLESFLVELENILEVIKKDEMPVEEYERVYNHLVSNLKEH